ncbi:uncharacterized protein [Arachis hypogaea]|uniref:uncharacterized protein n=1 Tax=Arachis hypogaea TaxID=3818 RepID=UPI003B221FE6
MNSGTVDQLFTSEWHFVYQEASSPASAWGSDHATDINDLGLHRTILTDEEENDCDFVYDISRDAKRNGFEFTDAIDSETIFDTKHAADERIRLEELRQKVLPEIGYQLLHSYSEQIKDWGWMCNIHVHFEPYKRNLDVSTDNNGRHTYSGTLYFRCQLK